MMMIRVKINKFYYFSTLNPMRMIRLHMQMIMVRRIKLQISLRQTYLIIKPVQLLIVKIVNNVTNTENTRIVAIIKCVSHFFLFGYQKTNKSQEVLLV